MSTVTYPTRDGYTEQRETVFVVYATDNKTAAPIERIAGIFEYESEALQFAVALSLRPRRDGIRIVQTFRLPEGR